MFQLGFSLVRMGYSLIFAMVLAGFLWNDVAYYQWRKTNSVIFQTSECDLKWHCDKCRIISLSQEQQHLRPPYRSMWELMSKREKLDYIANHECDPFKLLCKGVRPPAIFTSKSDIWKSPWFERFCAAESVERLFPPPKYMVIRDFPSPVDFKSKTTNKFVAETLKVIAVAKESTKTQSRKPASEL